MSNTPRPPGPGTPLQAPPPSRGPRAPRLPTPRTDLDRTKPNKQGTPTTRSTAYSLGSDFVGKLERARRRESSSLKIFGSAATTFPLSCCPRRTKQERRHPSEKVLRLAKYADGRTRRAGARRGRQRLPLLRLPLGKDGLAPRRRLLPATYGDHTTRNERRRGDHPRYRGTSRANPQGISCGPGLCHGLSLTPSDETLAAFPSPIHRASWMGLFSGIRSVYPGGAGSLEVSLAHDRATQLPKAMRGQPGSISATRRLPLGRVRRPRRRRSGASGYAGSSRHPVGRARPRGCPRAARQEDAMRPRGPALL